MGCVHLRVEKEEAVRRCRERKRLMKLVLSRRVELAAAHMAYLQSLRNTGATLRQFAEVDSMAPVNAPPILVLPPSPPPLSPSPLPPPHFSPMRIKEGEGLQVEEDSIDMDDNDSCKSEICCLCIREPYKETTSTDGRYFITVWLARDTLPVTFMLAREVWLAELNVWNNREEYALLN